MIAITVVIDTKHWNYNKNLPPSFFPGRLPHQCTLAAHFKGCSPHPPNTAQPRLPLVILCVPGLALGTSWLVTFNNYNKKAHVSSEISPSHFTQLS